MLRRLICGIVIGLSAGPALAQMRTSPSVPMRTSPSVPMRTSPSTGMRSTAGGLIAPPGFGTGFGHLSGTSLTINGSGFQLNLNGELAGSLANMPGVSSSHLFGGGMLGGCLSDSCIAVPDANDILNRLPPDVRDTVSVIFGSDIGADFDVLCFPHHFFGSGLLGWPWAYIPQGFAYGWYPSGYTYQNGQMYVNETDGWGTLSQPGQSQASAQPQTPPEPPTALEVARMALITGDLDTSEAQYREHLTENPDDSAVLREYGVVMLASDRTEEGFAAIRKAYRDRPSLASSPLRLGLLGFDARRVRRLMSKVSPEANRVQTASAWLTLTVLLQAQDKARPASRMLDNAEKQGLEPEVVQALQSALQS